MTCYVTVRLLQDFYNRSEQVFVTKNESSTENYLSCSTDNRMSFPNIFTLKKYLLVQRHRCFDIPRSVEIGYWILGCCV